MTWLPKVWWTDPGWTPSAHQSHSVTLLLSWAEERKYNTRLVGRDEDREILWGAVLQEQVAPAWVPHGVTSPASKPAAAWAPRSTGPQVLPGASSIMGSPQGHSILQASTCSDVGSSTGHGGTACLTMVFIMGYRGTSSPAPGAPLPLLLHRPCCLQAGGSLGKKKCP